MKSLILALATALPQYSVDQAELAKKIINVFNLKNNSAQSIEKLYNKSQIKRRYSVLKEIEGDLNQSIFFKGDSIPGTKLRNDIYVKEAPKLAKEAAQKAVIQWGRDPKEITHIISVSCTGVMAPGIEFILQQELGLQETVQKLGINFMGCFGAFRGLAVASALAKENPDNRILLVCTELCSLHFQITTRPDVLIGNALFADGAAAVIVGADRRDKEEILWQIENFGSYALQNSQDKMTWTISDHGFIMTLDRDIPNIIEQNINRIIAKFLNTKDFNNFEWAIHPGGKAIVEAIEKCFNLTKQQTKASWNILENYGNMSSATFLFVLEELKKQTEKNDKPVIGIGFGPGLSIETVLLSK